MGSKYKIQLGKALKFEHGRFIPPLRHLKTIKVHGREYSFIDKPVTPLKLSFFKGAMFDVLRVLYEEQAYSSHPGSVNSARISLRQIADRSGCNKKTVTEVLDRMIEIGLVKVLVKGVKSVGGAVYLITEPLDNLLNQLPDDVLNSLGFTDKQKVRVTKDFRDKPLNDKEKEPEDIENSPLEEVKPQPDQEVSSFLDDQKVENETEHPRVMPDWGNNWTPDDDNDDFLFKSETVADASSGSEADTPTIRWGNIPNQEKAKADETDWDELLAELGVPIEGSQFELCHPGVVRDYNIPGSKLVYDDNQPF
ncbi:TPA: hypothetical protein ACNE4N_004559 [Escherichia coli]